MTASLGTGLIVSAMAIAALRATTWLLSLLDLPLQHNAAIEIGFYLGALGIVAWAAVGVLRTAWRVRGVPGRNLVIFAVVCLTALVPVGLRTAIATRELGLLATGRDPLGAPASFTRDGAVVMLDGMLALGSAKKFAIFASRLKEGDLLVLNSPGGRIAEAEKIAAIIDRLRLTTHVDEECSSACTMLMLAGQNRSADVGARIGFHQPTQDGNNAIEDLLSAEPLREYYLAAGVDPGFVKKALTIRSDDLWYPDTDELKHAGVISRITIGYRLSSLSAFFVHEKSWDLDKDFSIVGAATDGTTLELRYRIKAKSRFHRRGANIATAVEQLIANSCRDEDFAAVIDHGARLVLRPYEAKLPTLIVGTPQCRYS